MAMMSSLADPSVSRNAQNLQLRYELPYRIHTASVYPELSPNGSSIIIYGHESGVRIIWRGGRPFKAQRPATKEVQKPNGKEDAVILLDSDEEDGGHQFEDKAEFEEDEEDFNPAKPYPSIRQTLDLYLGSDVLHIAVLPKLDGGSLQHLESLHQKIVFAAACADGSVRLVTLPICPPSPASKGREEFAADFAAAQAGGGKWGETIVLLSGHQKPSADLAVTLYTNESDAKSTPELWVASHSSEGAGLLLLWRYQLGTKSLHLEPSQKVSLTSTAVSIAFHPTVGDVASTRLLIADLAGACRIFDFVPAISISQRAEIEGSISEKGCWVLAVYVGFQRTDTPVTFLGDHANFGRKSIVDAKWVAKGRAIIVLLSNGEWGIWDIEGIQSNGSQGLLHRKGISGGSFAEFNLKGVIEGSANVRTSTVSHNAYSKFHPMTPGTRKMIDPFSSRRPQGPVLGAVSVLDVPPNSPTSSADESILIWLGETFTAIPSLSKYWAVNSRKKVGGSSLFGNNLTGRMIQLEGINFQGDRCTGICQLHSRNKVATASGLITDAILLGERRFIVLAPVRKELSRPRSSGRPSEALAKSDLNGQEDLDVMEIDDILDEMENGNGAVKRLQFGR